VIEAIITNWSYELLPGKRDFLDRTGIIGVGGQVDPGSMTTRNATAPDDGSFYPLRGWWRTSGEERSAWAITSVVGCGGGRDYRNHRSTCECALGIFWGHVKQAGRLNGRSGCL